MANNERILASFKKAEEKLQASKEAIDMLKAVTEGIESSHPDYFTNLDLIRSAELSFSFTTMRLTIKKAQLGVVGDKFYQN